MGVGRAADEKQSTAQHSTMESIKKGAGANMDMLAREVEIMQTVSHKNVIYMREMFDTPTKLYLMMELVTGGELFDRIVNRGSYSEKDASEVVRQIVEATENLLCATEAEDSSVKIADFGLSRIISEETMLKTACGTPGYVAPEVLKGKGYDKAVDMWSVGVITYILLCGFPPFYDDNVQVLFEQIMAGSFDYPDPWWSDVSDSAKDFINKLLDVDPKKRLNAAEALNHPWIQGGTAKTTHMENTIKSMKNFNARRKFKMAVLATIVARTGAAALAKK